MIYHYYVNEINILEIQMEHDDTRTERNKLTLVKDISVKALFPVYVRLSASYR
uniref:Uncharacterized protein n=1 Tax=Arion vulgaris TaxID=1028688 RepID=A0A0B7BG70_9EUPU